MVIMLIVWWKNMGHALLAKCKRERQVFNTHLVQAAALESQKSSELEILVSQCVLLQWGSSVSVEENP